MTSFLDLAKERYSSRNYFPIPVEEEKLLYVLEAGRIAPSAANFQPWHFVVIQNTEMLEKIYPVYNRDWVKQAPVLIVICGDHTTSWKRADRKDHCDIDIAIATDHMTLAATEQGLSTCWICNFDAALCSNILELPNHIEPIVILSLGYPTKSDDNSRHSRRKQLSDIIHWDKF